MAPNKSFGGRLGRNYSGFAGRALRERGIALVMVLWLTLVLSVVAVSVVRIARGDVRIAFNLQEAAKAEALADGGIYLAVASLMKPGEDDRWPLDGSPREFIIAGELVTVSIRDEGSKIDLNTANYEMLEAAALSVGMGEQEASRVADALITERLARSSQSVAVGVSRRPPKPSGWFATIRELQPVASLNRADYERLRNLVTVYVGQRAPNGITRALVRRSTLTPPANALNNARSLSNTYAIISRVGLESGAGFERYAVVRLSAGGSTGYQVLQWD